MSPEPYASAATQLKVIYSVSAETLANEVAASGTKAAMITTSSEISLSPTALYAVTLKA